MLKGVDFDPVSVFWENQHNDDRIVRWNAWRGAVKVVIFFIVVPCSRCVAIFEDVR